MSDEQAIVPAAAAKPKRQLPEGMKAHMWKPGVSGNPDGRPKKLTKVLDRLLDAKDENGKTKAENLVEAAIRRATRKSDFALKEVWERAEGKMPTPLSGADGGPVQFQVAVVYANVKDE